MRTMQAIFGERPFSKIHVDAGGRQVPVLMNPRPWHVTAHAQEMQASISQARHARDRRGIEYVWMATAELSDVKMLEALALQRGFLQLPILSGHMKNGAVLDSDPTRPKITGRPKEVVYVKIRGQNVEIIKNPTKSDLSQMVKEVRREFMRLPQEEAIRFRYSGPDVFAWKAHLALHSDVGGGQGVGFGMWFDVVKSKQ